MLAYIKTSIKNLSRIEIILMLLFLYTNNLFVP